MTWRPRFDPGVKRQFCAFYHFYLVCTRPNSLESYASLIDARTGGVQEILDFFAGCLH